MSNTINLVIFGKIGIGKSSTGNSILGRDAFEPHLSWNRSSTSELQSTLLLKDGRVLNVIDTPGLDARSFEDEFTSTEIVRCANLAKDGIHAILMVFSLESRLSPDEDAAIKILKTCFGPISSLSILWIFNYSQASMSNLIWSIRNLLVLFDNVTCDVYIRARQLGRLMQLVDTVIASNCGKPFSDEKFHKVKAFQKIVQNVEELDKRLAKEQAALSLVEVSEEGNIEDEEDIRKLKESLEQARRDLNVFLKERVTGASVSQSVEACLKYSTAPSSVLAKRNIFCMITCYFLRFGI